MFDGEQLKQNVFKNFGSEHCERFSKSLDSILARIAHCGFHIEELMAIEALATGNRDRFDLAKDLFRRDSQIGIYGIKAGAHALAALQSLHAISDITGTAVIYALEERSEWHGYLGDAIKAVEKYHEKLALLMETLRSSEDYDFLCAAVNESKHNNIVNSVLTVNLDGSRSHGYDFIYFERKERKKDLKKFAPRPIIPFFSQEYKRQVDILVMIANELVQLTSREINPG